MTDLQTAEALAAALDRIDQAAAETWEADLRRDSDLSDAFDLVAQQSGKGELLRKAWDKALRNPDPRHRSLELARIAKSLKGSIGIR